MKTIASIVLLIKNAEAFLPGLLDALFDQETDIAYELIAIDSGSKDRSLEILSSHAVRIIQIAPHEFNHGGTRNLGAQQADPGSEYIVYITQDAKPYDRHWLANLLIPFKDRPEVAGVFSRHIPRPRASVSTVRQLVTLSQTGGTIRLEKSMPTEIDLYEQNKFYYIYFSNTSSAIRRSVWHEIPFDPVDFAEDAVWADKVIRAGYTLVFEPSSIVIHSHDYNVLEQFRQNVDHAHAMNALFKPAEYQNRKLWLKMFAGIPIQVWLDYKFMRGSEYFWHEPLSFKLSTLLRSPFWQFATILGGWTGAHLDKMPPFLNSMLSHQERIRQS